ncbi:G-type lectin S-receptor-like serine/threonine-protein kinase LECRK2 [Ziziphus jujuba]|uniref:Receptor-like serine/threonine-protein kinase n=1 Tax=Ziziphus jujuba TaxID=326968 RepID=A0A6P6FY13_ZIZJJ|nr:G-type lectin S-receptor-like serine/threonine-protein kinase LECRK2 [Ziziphus jujuba]
MASSPLPWNLLYLLLFSPFPQSSAITCQTHRITKGFSLTASFNKHVPLESPSREFAFGFQRIKSDGFLLAVWLNKIPEKTIVWSANRDNLVQEGSKVVLNDSGLILTDQTDKRIWHTDTFGVGVSYGEILNTGNLVLYDQISAISWQSFNEPTDTLLPKQILSRGKSLVARYSEDNYSSGRFLFMLESNGNLVLYTRNFPQNAPNYAYWKSETEGSGFQVMFNESGAIYLQAKNGNILKYLSMTSSSMKDFYQRAILENDGVFRQYVYPKGGDPTSSGWHEFRSESLPSIPPNICTSISGEDTAGGACGFNSYCRIGVNQRRTCSCPSGYTFIDPSDPVKGCKQNFEAQSCDGEDHDDLFEFYSMEQTDWPYGDYQHFKEVDEEWCKKACLSDCFCAVAIFRGRECWKKRVPFANGMMDPSLSGKALIKVRKNDSSPGHPDKNDRSVLVLIGSLLLSGSVFMNLLLLLAAFLVAFYLNPKSKAIQPNPVASGINLQVFTYEELNKATNKFNEQLGNGAFATVYKGVLPSEDGNLIAVKKLHHLVSEGEREFKAEVIAIGRTNHRNLVQLIGFCNEDQHRLLVYEFMSNGSLANFIFGPSRPNWHRRMRTAQGTARGLFYLHEECSIQIIHCDIKPQNILLDDFYTARISDFGLAKLLKKDQTRTTTGIRGTRGYVAPEWFKNLPVSAKVDVYSFGIVLLELICCRKNFEAEAQENQMILSDWAYDCYHDRNLKLLVENDEEAMADIKRVEKYVMVAIWCIQEDPSLRPTMKEVTQMLEETIEVAVPPDLPSFTSSF